MLCFSCFSFFLLFCFRCLSVHTDEVIRIQIWGKMILSAVIIVLGNRRAVCKRMLGMEEMKAAFRHTTGLTNLQRIRPRGLTWLPLVNPVNSFLVNSELLLHITLRNLKKLSKDTFSLTMSYTFLGRIPHFFLKKHDFHVIYNLRYMMLANRKLSSVKLIRKLIQWMINSLKFSEWFSEIIREIYRDM